MGNGFKLTLDLGKNLCWVLDCLEDFALFNYPCFAISLEPSTCRGGGGLLLLSLSVAFVSSWKRQVLITACLKDLCNFTDQKGLYE